MEEPEPGVVITSTDGGEFTVQIRFGGEDSKRDDVTEESSTATTVPAVNGVGGGEREKGEASASAVFQEEDPESVSS